MRGEKLALYLALAAGRLVAVDDETLRIGIESEAMRRDLMRRDVQTLLARVATEAFGRTLGVEIVPTGGTDDTVLKRVQERQDEARADPVVQYAVEVFGGEVRSTRERRS